MQKTTLFLKGRWRAALLILLLSAVGMTKMYADVTIGDLNYSLNSSALTATVTGHKDGISATGNLIIPSSVTYGGQTYTVTAIGNNAFQNCSGLTGTLNIPNSVTFIGGFAFENCSSFTGDLVIPNSVTTMGGCVFDGCSGFTGNLTIGNSLTSIGINVFGHCGFTGNLTIGNSVTTIGSGAFQYCSGFTGSLTIPNSVTTIGINAFYGCSGFTGSLTIGNSVTLICLGAFYGCSGFTGDLVIPNSVITIDGWDNFTGAFGDCIGFTGLTIGNSVVTIGPGAFGGCTGFTGDLTIPNSVMTIGNSAFASCSGFTGDLTIPNSVMTIGNTAFFQCTGFTGDLTIGNSVTTIGEWSFRDCSGFTGTLTIGNSVTTIGNSAFVGCSGFTGSLTIPNSVTEIGDYAFSGCSGFTGSLTIPNSVTTIRSGAFHSCSGFTGSLTIPNSVTSIGTSAFVGCSGFTGSLTIPNSVIEIGDNAFAGCTGFIGSLTIGNSVSTIGYYAFANCSGFTGNLTIPNSVTTIDMWAFKDCTGFTGSLTLGNSVTSIGSCAFYHCTGFMGDLVIPNSVTSIGYYAFNGCNGFTGDLIIGNSVTTIGNWAFSSGFTSINVFSEIPPALGENVFLGVNKSISVYVPCGSLDAYQSANGWNEFTNIQEACDMFTVTAMANPTNGGSVSGSGTYLSGQTCTLTATANEGYSFLYWADYTGNVVSMESDYSFMVAGDATLTANFVEEGYCGVKFDLYDSYGDGWNGNSLVVNYQDGTTQALTFSSGPSATYILPIADRSHVTLGWIPGSYIGECSFRVSYLNDNEIYYGSNMNGNFAFDFNMDCEGMPETPTFDITATANHPEGGSVYGTGTYRQGETCTLTANDNWGYHFVSWTKDGEVVSTTREYSFVVIESGTYVAYFDEGGYTIEATANPTEGGFIEGIGEYYYGDYCELVATANEGYTFMSWTEDGEVVSTDTYYSFTVTANRNLLANFTEGIVVYDGDATNGYVPVYGYYTDAYLKCETVYPSESLAALSGGSISAMRFFSNQSNVNWGNAYFQVFLKEVDDTYINEFGGVDDAVVVYEGPISIVDGMMNVIFNTSYPYNGGNLLVGVYNMVQGSYVSSTWYGQTVDGASVQGYSYNGLDAISPTQRNFIPKTMFFYSAGLTPTYTITATANSAEGGTVSGGGTYTQGTTCTLTATANMGYTFTNWTKEGVEVSTDATLSFTVTESASYVANFTESASDFHWDVNASTYPNTLTMIGVIEINNVEQMSTTLEVGAFCGDECRGRDRATANYVNMFGHYFVFLTVYGNDNDQINFRLYDHAIGQELNMTCSPLVFQTNGLFGNPGAPYVFDFSMSQITQSTDITLGWNWWSTYVEADDLFGQLKTGLGANASQIKSSTSFVNYFSGLWIGGLNSINNESCYLINASNACTFEMTGSPATPANHPITINPNWNWIGYPNTGETTVANAFSNFTPSNGDQVKSQNSFSTYYSGMWVGGLNTITPGMGLLYKSNSTGAETLIYPEPNRSEEVVENVTNEDNHWTADYHAYPSNMTVMAVIELDDVELQGENYEIAAFANGECRGSARLMFVEPLNRYVAFLTVVGDEASELRFSLYNDGTGTVETQSIASLQYETNTIVGSLETPYVIRFRSTTDVDEWANNVNIFPNPVNCGEQFSLGLPAVETLRATSVQIVNALGVVVETLRATSVPEHITAPNVAGVYTLRITIEGKGTCFRKLVVR